MEKLISVPDDAIARRIYFIRGHRVMVDRDLALLYGVETKKLKQAVRRNIERFPGDFMFEMNDAELENWRSYFVTSNSADKMGLRYPPFCFTEQGVAMLSSVLKSKMAIAVNIQIVHIFTRLREIMQDNREILVKLELLEKKVGDHDKQLKTIFDALRNMLRLKEKPSQKIGFRFTGEK